MKNNINIAVVGLGQIGNYLLNELNNKKKEIKLLTGKDINVVIAAPFVPLSCFTICINKISSLFICIATITYCHGFILSC